MIAPLPKGVCIALHDLGPADPHNRPFVRNILFRMLQEAVRITEEASVRNITMKSGSKGVSQQAYITEVWRIRLLHSEHSCTTQDKRKLKRPTKHAPNFFCYY